MVQDVTERELREQQLSQLRNELLLLRDEFDLARRGSSQQRTPELRRLDETKSAFVSLTAMSFAPHSPPLSVTWSCCLAPIPANE